MKKQQMRSLLSMVKGLGITFRHLFEKPVTVSYPEQKRKPAERFKGRHWLRLWQDGMDRCVGCKLCEVVCPSQAILVLPAENPADKPVSKAKRYAAQFQINELRCIFCGSCEEVCPVDAIVLSEGYEMAGYSRQEMIYTKEKLNEPFPGASGRDPLWGPRTAPKAAPAPAAQPTAPKES